MAKIAPFFVWVQYSGAGRVVSHLSSSYAEAVLGVGVRSDGMGRKFHTLHNKRTNTRAGAEAVVGETTTPNQTCTTIVFGTAALEEELHPMLQLRNVKVATRSGFKKAPGPAESQSCTGYMNFATDTYIGTILTATVNHDSRCYAAVLYSTLPGFISYCTLFLCVPTRDFLS